MHEGHERMGVLLFVLVVMCIVGGVVFSLVCRLLAMPQVWQRVGY